MVNQVSLDINSMVVSNHRKLQRHGVAVRSTKATRFYFQVVSGLKEQNNMPRKLKKNHGRRCLGVLGSTEKCNRARDGSGAIWMNKACEKCKE